MFFNYLKAALCTFVLFSGMGVALAQQTPDAPSDVAPKPEQASEPEVRSVQFGDWFYRCTDVRTAEGSIVPNCEVAQVSQVTQHGKDVNVLTLAFARIDPDPVKKDKKQVPALLLTALVPLNIFLPSGFMIDADGNSVAEFSYRKCNEAGCWAQQKLDPTVIAALQKGTNGGARLQLMNGQYISIKFSLKGLTEALTALR
jgi:invasion protein IalB